MHLRCTQCNPFAPYQYLLPTVYLCMADIANSTCLHVVAGPGFVPTSPAFMRSPVSHPAGSAWPACKLGIHCCGQQV